MEFVDSLPDTHEHARKHMEISARNKKQTDTKQREVIFEPGELVWVVLTKDCMPLHEYNNIHSRKIGQVDVLKRIIDNACRLRLPAHIKRADVFNVKYLSRFHGVNDIPNSETNLLLPGEI